MSRVGYTYFIIEHPTRGTVRELEFDDNPRHSGGGLKPRFSTTGMRNDPDRAKQYRSVEHAITDVVAIAAANEKLANQLKIRRSSDWKYLCSECNQWCEQWFNHAKTCSVYTDELKAHGIKPFRQV